MTIKRAAIQRAFTLMITAALLLGCSRGDPLDRALRSDAGREAIDCGRGEAANPCVAEAFKAHKPFRARFGAIGKAAAPSGAVYFYSFDLRKQRVTRFTCNKPQLESHGDHVHLVCMSCLECTGQDR